MAVKLTATLSLVSVTLGLACARHTDQSADPPTVRGIVGGSAATTCQWPTAIMVNPIGCSGSLVHRRAIVTAKHCLLDPFGNPSPPTAVGIGDSKSNFAKTVAIAKCHGHPTTDFAICTLVEDVTDIPIVPVMAPCEMPLLTKGASVVEVGFGTDKVSNGTYGTKRWIAGTLTANAASAADITVTSGSQDGEYFGDSGGPLFLRMPDTTWRVVGEDCCSDDIITGSSAPRVSTYTSVPFHVVWAEQETGLDLTPCHDSRGWAGGDECTGFPTEPDRTTGAWSSMCRGQDSLLAATCGGASYDGGADGAGGTAFDAKLGAIDAETGTRGDVETRDGSRSESFEPALDGSGGDGVVDSNAAVDMNTGTDGAGGVVAAGSGGAGGSAVSSGGTGGGTGATGGTAGGTGGAMGGTGGAMGGTGGAMGGTGGATGGTTHPGGTGGMAMDGAAGSDAVGMPQAGGNTGPGALDADEDATVDGGAASVSSGCSCRLQAGQRPAPYGLLFSLASFATLGIRRARKARSRILLTCAALVALASVAACGSGDNGPLPADARSAEVDRGTDDVAEADDRPPSADSADAPSDGDGTDVGATATDVGGAAWLDADLPMADTMVSETNLAPPSDAPASFDAGSTEAGGCTLADSIAFDEMPRLSFASYHSVADIIAYLSAVAAALPGVVEAQTLGHSIRGRSIPYVVINATCHPTPPAVLLVGTHHGDEWSSTEAALAHVDYLLRGETDVRALLRSYAFYVVPVLNVDGHDATPPTRANAAGVDLNRDYAYPERPESSSFQQPETQSIKALQDRVGFRAALAFHSGTTSVLWPWCYSATPAPDDARLSSIGAQTAQAMGFLSYAASYFDYPTQGEYIDYAYMKSKTLAFTVEVSLVKTPAVSTIPQIVATAWKGTLALMRALQSNHAPAVAVPSRMAEHAPRHGEDRLE